MKKNVKSDSVAPRRGICYTDERQKEEEGSVFSLFRRIRERRQKPQTSTECWQDQWRSLVPPECRNVPIENEGESIIAYICIHHFAVMLQDGLLMEGTFFPVCEHFQRAGYHVVWLMRATQDIRNGYLKKKGEDRNDRRKWNWTRPTTNFGRWMSDQQKTTILIQHTELPDGDIKECGEKILARVVWADSDDPALMVPGHTDFWTEDLPASPKDLLRWLNGESLAAIAEDSN